MNVRTLALILTGALSVCVTLLGSVLAVGQTPSMPRSAKIKAPTTAIISSQQSSDLVKTASLAGEYKGRVPVGDDFKPAKLILKDGLGGDNFILQVSGEEAITGRIAGEFYLRSKIAFASVKLSSNAEAMGGTESSSVSLRLLKTDSGLTLKNDTKVLFETCNPYPRCQNQGGCEPCEP